MNFILRPFKIFEVLKLLEMFKVSIVRVLANNVRVLRFKSFVVFVFFVLITATSCDQPTERRRIVSVGDYGTDSSSSSDSSSTTGTGISSNNASTNTASSTVSTTTNPLGDSSSSSLKLPAEFAHCNMNPPKYNSNASLIGDYNVCVSNESNSTKIIFQSKSSITDYPLCMFPVNGNSVSSVMIGDAKCLPTPVLADKVYTIQFAINRVNYTSSVMTGVIFMKNMPYDGEVTAYNYNPSTTTYPEAYSDCMRFYATTNDNLPCIRFKSKGKYFTYFFVY